MHGEKRVHRKPGRADGQDADDGGFDSAGAGQFRSSGHHVTDTAQARDARGQNDHVGDPPGRVLPCHPSTRLLSIHSAQDALRPQHVQRGTSHPTGKRKSPADRLADNESNDDSEHHRDQDPDRDGVAEKLREGIHTADLTTSTVGWHCSSNNAVAQVNNARGFEHPVEFQGGPACLEAVEEALSRHGKPVI